MIHLRRRWLVLGGLVLIVGGLLTWFLWPQPSAVEQLAAARARWEARPFTHYRLVVEEESNGVCQSEAEIQDEHVLTVTQNTCYKPPSPVSDSLKGLDRILALGCSTKDCSCDKEYLAITVRYDPELGYPQEIHIGWEKNLLYPFTQWWRDHVITSQGCSSARGGGGGGTIRIRSLTPLP